MRIPAKGPLGRVVNSLTQGRVKFGWWTAPWFSTESPIIIGGSSRSGTTLLKQLLGAHRDICMGPETGILNNNRRFELLARQSGMSIRDVRRIFYSSVTIGDFYQRFNTTLMRRAAKIRWGEKTPANVQALPLLFRCFPQAHFIHAIRDGRDVVCSLRNLWKYRWSGGERVETGIVLPWAEAIHLWKTDVELGIAWRDDPRCFEVRYESLVDDPRATLDPLLQWLDLAWDPGVLTGYRSDAYHLQPRLAGPIVSASAGRWREDLPLEARRLFRGGANDFLIDLGYTHDDTWIESPLPK